MLADEYVLIFLLLSASVPAEQLLSAFCITSTLVFQSAYVRADVTENTSTAESPNVMQHLMNRQMRNILKLQLAFLAISISAWGQKTPKNIEIYFQRDKELKFVLDDNSFKKIDQESAKSTTSDFTISGYHVITGTFDELVSKAKSQLVQIFQTMESKLFIKKITKPNFEGVIIFGTNGQEASSIYLFKANKGFGWVTMTFKHDQKETEKIDLIITSIEQTK